MKNILIAILLISSLSANSQIVYVDNFDAVYEASLIETKNFNFDLNSDGENDINLEIKRNTSQSNKITCPNENGSVSGWGWNLCNFNSLQNIYGQNKVNAPAAFGELSFDCTNDTLNISDSWNNSARIYVGFIESYTYCAKMGIGNHKQGFRLIKKNTVNNALGYIYGYIDYTMTNIGDIIIHGWYYESSFNVPIVANTLLDYPYDENCIHIDTVTVYDTVRTYISVTDTLLIKLNVPNITREIFSNHIKIYPNPASSHIYIDFTDIALLQNYEIQILNMLSQTVYFTTIEEQQYFIDLNTWGGIGTYFVNIRNNLGAIVVSKKIILH